MREWLWPISVLSSSFRSGPVHVAYLINTYPRASQTFIRREIQALERRGWQVTRIAMRSDRAQLVDPSDIAEDAKTHHVLARGVKAILGPALKTLLGRPGPAWRALRLALQAGRDGAGGGAGTGGRMRHLVYLAEAALVAERCRAAGIRHIHAHFGTNSATVAMLAAAFGGLSFSFTTHGPEEFDAPRALSLGRKVEAAAFAVAISSFGRSQLSRWVAPDHWNRIEVVHCGIEPERFPDPAPVTGGAPRLVAVGRLSEQKGFPLLLDALARAAPSVPGLTCEIIGDGPMRDLLHAQARALGLGSVVRFLGLKPEAEVRAALARAQALVLPSFAEGLPMVVMESFAAGRPVIATAIAGVPELVTPETGWLIPAGDAEALAEAMMRLAATDAETLQRMGAAARARVFARHDIDGEAEKLARLFAQALDRPQA